MSDFEVSVDGGNKGNANLIYILYLVSIVLGVTSIVGVIMAYMGRGEAPDWLKSHYTNQIHIFWKGLLYSVISLLLTAVLIGFLLLLGVLIWYIVRTIQGMQALGKGEPAKNPTSWLL